METIQKYKAYNGTEFTDSSKCEEYESNCRIADAIIARLPEKPDDCDFSNGGGYIQHTEETFFSVRGDLLRQAEKEYSHKWFKQSLEDRCIDASWAARMIGECCTRQLDRAWMRIYCTDKDLREWGQPYYAMNPEKGTQRQIS